MSSIQIASLMMIVVLPAMVWLFDRRPHTAHLVRICERGLAGALIFAHVGDLLAKVYDGTFTLEFALPMQLCDWALFLISAALWWRWRLGFELAYFWGLAGTIQALFTPAIAPDLHWLRIAGFFFIHAGIVTGVVHLLVTGRFRPQWPQSLIRVVVASEIYLATALLVNHLTGGNYGFLAHKPETRSMLDLFSDERWIYVMQINLVAFVFFAALYLPWVIIDWRKGALRRCAECDR